MSKNVYTDSFWVSNITDRNVSLTDLGLTIPAYKSVNLLDTKHYSLTREELETSAKSGSLFLKCRKVVVRQVPPVIEKKQFVEIDYNAVAPTRRRSAVKIEHISYQELDIPDELFAQEAADLIDRK